MLIRRITFKTYKLISYIILLLPLMANSKIVDTSSLDQINKDYEELCNNYSPKDILMVLGREKVIFKSFSPPIIQLNKNELSKLQEIFKSVKPSKDTYFEFDLLKQKEIAEKYRKIEEIKNNIKRELEKIENIKVDIGL